MSKKTIVFILASFLVLCSSINVSARKFYTNPCCDPCATVKPEKKLSCQEELKLAKAKIAELEHKLALIERIEEKQEVKDSVVESSDDVIALEKEVAELKAKLKKSQEEVNKVKTSLKDCQEEEKIEQKVEQKTEKKVEKIEKKQEVKESKYYRGAW